jgi:hypothetical protein
MLAAPSSVSGKMMFGLRAEPGVSNSSHVAAITYVIIKLAAITYGIVTVGRYNLPVSYGL